MSHEAVTWAFDRAPVEDRNAAFVLVALAERADPDGTKVFPSVGDLARRCRMSKRTVDKALAALRDAGLIVREKRRARGPVQYRLALGIAHAATRQEAPGIAQNGDGIAHVATRGIAHVGAYEPPREPSEEPSPSASADDRTTLDARAKNVTDKWWQGFDPRPSGNYLGFRRIIRSLLAAGWSEETVLEAAQDCGRTFNRAAMERVLSRIAERPRPKDAWRMHG